MTSLGIIGGGFSGLSVLAALVRHATRPLQITLYNAEGVPGRGKAYSTSDPDHLLNVRAGAMGAHAGQDDDFFLWLIAEGISCEVSDFMPRSVYGRYLDSVLAETLITAQKKDVRIFVIHEKILTVQSGSTGLAIKAGAETCIHNGIILACGNDKPRVPVLGIDVPNHAGWWQNPYSADRWPDISHAGHIIILGSGLSMIDALVTLKREKYEGDITVISRHGYYPLPHAPFSNVFLWDDFDALSIKTLSMLVRQVRLKAIESGADWRDVLDGLRSHSNRIWRNFSARDRARAFRYMSLWNLYRHRIPQAMYDLVRECEAQGQLRMVAADVHKIETMSRSLNVYTSDGVKEGQIVINCMGYDYRITPDDKGLLAELVRAGMVRLDEGFPQPVSDALKLSHDHALYAVGPLLQGYLIESTAVREIRQQADVVAKDILESAA